ncbi:MAG TPA: Clp protease N-terminal domain-containing protein [Gaiellaceae bacterium]|nr:Clp protease N-terminal domain-containing protein [Gaiellaceae bacterium]
MFERFTEPARRVVVLASDEARALRYRRLGTEHLLLGLLQEQKLACPTARRVLLDLGVDPERVRRIVVAEKPQGDIWSGSGQIPFTENAKLMLEHAQRAADVRRHRHIGSEHVLLGLAQVEDSTAARILHACGFELSRIAAASERIIGPV